MSALSWIRARRWTAYDALCVALGPLLPILIAVGGCTRDTEEVSTEPRNISIDHGSDTSGEAAITHKCLYADHDFGFLSPGAIVKHRFPVTNDSAYAWTFRDVTTSCSCTAPQLSATRIEPGTTEHVTVSYRAGSSGDQTGRVTLRFAEPESPLVEFRLAARVRRAMEVSPDSLAFQSLTKGAPAESILVVENFSDHTWQRIAVQCPDTWLSYSTVPMVLAGGKLPRQAWRVLVRLDTNKLVGGRQQTDLHVRESADRRDLAAFMVPIHAHLVPSVEVIPDQMFFGTVRSNAPAERDILVRFAPNCIPRQASDVELRHNLDSAIRLQWKRIGGQFWDLAGTLTPTSAVGVVEGKITLAFPVSTLPTIEIPVRVKIVNE